MGQAAQSAGTEVLGYATREDGFSLHRLAHLHNGMAHSGEGTTVLYGTFVSLLGYHKRLAGLMQSIDCAAKETKAKRLR